MRHHEKTSLAPPPSSPWHEAKTRRPDSLIVEERDESSRGESLYSHCPKRRATGWAAGSAQMSGRSKKNGIRLPPSAKLYLTRQETICQNWITKWRCISTRKLWHPQVMPHSIKLARPECRHPTREFTAASFVGMKSRLRQVTLCRHKTTTNTGLGRAQSGGS